MLYSNSQQFNTGINTIAILERFRMKQDKINEIYAQLQNVFDTYTEKVSEKVNEKVKERRELARTRRLPGSVSGPIKIVSGATGLVLFGGLSLGFGLGSILLGMAGSSLASLMIFLLSFFLPLTGLSGFFLGWGIFTRKRVERLKKYLAIMSNKAYIMLDDLSAQSDQPMKLIKKDAHYLLDHNLLPGAKMDQQETCLLLTGEAINQYEMAMESQRLREEEARRKQKQLEEWDRVYDDENEMHDFVIRAEDYLTQVDEYHSQIYSPTVKESLTRLSVILRQIFVCVRQHPEKVRLTRQLMNYYIPSTIKLLSTYDDLEKQPIQGENIQTTRKEIETSLVTINNSLETMFDELFQEEAIDISSDIQVLNAILERDGWKQNTFNSNQKTDI